MTLVYRTEEERQQVLLEAKRHYDRFGWMPAIMPAALAAHERTRWRRFDLPAAPRVADVTPQQLAEALQDGRAPIAPAPAAGLPAEQVAAIVQESVGLLPGPLYDSIAADEVCRRLRAAGADEDQVLAGMRAVADQREHLRDPGW